MIKAQDLRIGNLLIVGGMERLVFVSAIFRTHFRCEDKNGISFEESIRVNYLPIPLTEEMLLKVGFEKHHPEGNLYSLPWVLTSLCDGEKIDKNFSVALFEGFSVACQCQNTHFRYLHQLQNLFYFTSQGQELNTAGLI